MYVYPFRLCKAQWTSAFAHATHLLKKRPDADPHSYFPTASPPGPDENPTLEPDHYAVLGLPAGSPIESVRAQYRLLAKRRHPDLTGGGGFWQDHFKKINAAYAFLAEPGRKAAYDRWRTTRVSVFREGPPLTL